MKSKGIPIGSRGSKRSENSIAASISSLLTGWSVTSAASSGCLQISSNVYCFRMALYSAMYRPACRINQTGVASTGLRLQAFKKRLFTEEWYYEDDVDLVNEFIS